MSFFSIGDQSNPIWMDGRLIPWDQATLHILSHGLNNASCVFEGERVYAGKIFKLFEHTQRLLESARILGFPLPYSATQLCDATESVVQAQKLRNGYIRPVAWRGHEDLGIAAPNAKVHVAIAALAFDDVLPPEARRLGISLKTSTWVRPAPNMAPVRAKASCHYVLGSLALQQAKADGFDDALLLDYRGYIAESTGSNFFLVVNDTLVTPSIECALNGITRQTVIDLAQRRGMKVIEKPIHPDEIASAQEAFLTGTACEILAVRRVDQISFPSRGRVTKILCDDYFALVGKENLSPPASASV